MPVQRPLLWRQSVEARPHLLGDGGATVAKVTPEETPQTSLPESGCNCGEPAHFARDCRQPKRPGAPSGKGTGGRRGLNAMQELEQEPRGG